MKRLFHPPGLFLALAAALLVGCAALGLQAPESLEDRIQYGKAGVSAAYRTLGDMVGARSVSKAKGLEVFTKLEAVEKQLTLAETLLKSGKPTDALSTVNLALAALTAVRAELVKKEV
jgi:hypothetical protein